MEKGVMELLAESTAYREAVETNLRAEEEEKLAVKGASSPEPRRGGEGC